MAHEEVKALLHVLHHEELVREVVNNNDDDEVDDRGGEEDGVLHGYTAIRKRQDLGVYFAICR